MLNKRIYDYEEFKNKMDELIQKSSTKKYKMTEIKNNWKTSCGLPINHYSIGNGKNHIVFFGAFHGSEIITTEFLLYFMDEITNKIVNFSEILDNYTLDFFPVVNPEGYIITTSIIRKYISRTDSLTKLQEKCEKYRASYKKDDLNDDKLRHNGLKSDHISIKNYQKIFQKYSWKDIPEIYHKIRDSLESLYKKYKIPDGAIIEWSANASGIDLNANTIYNKNISNIISGKTLYLPYRNSNIIYSEPGPKNCPFDRNYFFTDEIENTYINNFLEKLNNKKKLAAIFNYHSAGALIDQRPSKIPSDLAYMNINLKEKSLNNYLFAKIYQSETYKNFNNKEKTRYKILKDSSEIRTRNAYYRVVYPLNILVELSPIGGNPLGPYSNLETNYKSIMESNLNALIKSIKNLKLSNKISTEIYKWMDKNTDYKNENEFIEKGYRIIDEKYKKIKDDLL